MHAALLALAGALLAQSVPPVKEQLAGLLPYANCVGAWSGSGSSEKSSGWKEKIDGRWGFREKDGRVSINFYIEGSKLIKVGLLSFDPEGAKFRFSAKNAKDETIRFEGKQAAEGHLRLERIDKEGEDHLDRLELKLLRGGDKLLFDFRRKKGKNSFEQFALVELFREGGLEASAEKFEKGPFCVVTGGPGRVTFEHQGKTVTVADENCKEEYVAHPERYAGKK
jgi:hypothetical protein